MDYEIAYNIILIAVGVFVLVRAGVYIVKSLVVIAHFLNVSEFTLSFILMAFATTLPEFSIGVSSALKGEPQISLGNLLGANILTLGLILGLVTLISGKLVIHKPRPVAISHHWLAFFLGIAPLILLIDLKLSRLEGLILVILFFLYLGRLFQLKEIFHRDKSFWQSHFHEHHGLGAKDFFKNILIFILAAGFLIVSAFLVVNGAKSFSSAIGMSNILVGALIVAIGTTLPELSFGLRAAISKHGELSLGNLFGASVFNSTWVLGVVALIHPIEIQNYVPFIISAVFMFSVLLMANLFLVSRDYINRREGIGLILLYLAFFIIQLSLI